jgi:hypothetical protein
MFSALFCVFCVFCGSLFVTYKQSGISLWDIAKAALVRDLAERVLKGEIPPNDATADSLSHWLATKLLTPAELAQFEREGRPDHDSDDD